MNHITEFPTVDFDDFTVASMTAKETFMEITSSDPMARPGSNVSENQEVAAAEAESKGFEVVRSDDHTVLLDLDDQESVDHYTGMLPVVTQHIPLVEEARWASKDGGTHIKLRLNDPASVQERLLLQACLGSDPVKEFLGLVRTREGNDNPIMLFRPGN